MTIESQWKEFLKRNELDESKMREEQRKETKRAFFAGAGQILLLFNDLKYSEILNMLGEAVEFWNKESDKQTGKLN